MGGLFFQEICISEARYPSQQNCFTSEKSPRTLFTQKLTFLPASVKQYGRESDHFGRVVRHLIRKSEYDMAYLEPEQEFFCSFVWWQNAEETLLPMGASPTPPGVFQNRVGEEKAFYINQMC